MSALALWTAIAGAGALGSVARVGADAWIAARIGRPWGIACVNLVGALALGVLLGAGPGESLALVVGGGLLGSFTTFSTLMLDTAILVGRGERGRAGMNLAVQIALGCGAAALGLVLGHALAG